MIRFFIVTLSLSLGFVECRARAEEPFRYPEGKHGKGELAYVNGLPVLQVAGTPQEIGEQVGLLALKPIARNVDRLLKEFVNSGSPSSRSGQSSWGSVRAG